MGTTKSTRQRVTPISEKQVSTDGSTYQMILETQGEIIVTYIALPHRTTGSISGRVTCYHTGQRAVSVGGCHVTTQDNGQYQWEGVMLPHRTTGSISGRVTCYHTGQRAVSVGG